MLVAASGIVALVLLSLAAAAQPPSEQAAGAAETEKKSAEPERPRASVDDICRTLGQAAADNDLPLDFFTRLIWQESRFNPEAISSKGAMGIAQFMPLTASGRGLKDPFEPLQALRESASYLRELRTTFSGNLGLAAAAYNAGPGRVEAWIAGRRGLPGETLAYVRIITGLTAEAWRADPPPQWQALSLPKVLPCMELAKLIVASPRPPPPKSETSPAWGPWGVQLAGNWSEGKVLASYERLRRRYAVLADRLPLVLRSRLGRRGATHYIVRVSEASRREAEALCAKLRAVGGACIVLRNPRT